MNISNYADLLKAARQQPEPQRLLFVFTQPELPDGYTEAPNRDFEWVKWWVKWGRHDIYGQQSQPIIHPG